MASRLKIFLTLLFSTFFIFSQNSPIKIDIKVLPEKFYEDQTPVITISVSYENNFMLNYYPSLIVKIKNLPDFISASKEEFSVDDFSPEIVEVNSIKFIKENSLFKIPLSITKSPKKYGKYEFIVEIKGYYTDLKKMISFNFEDIKKLSFKIIKKRRRRKK